MNAPIDRTAYAVIDTTGQAPFDATHEVCSRYWAYRICRMRRNSATPLYPGAKWKVVKVRIIVR